MKTPTPIISQEHIENSKPRQIVLPVWLRNPVGVVLIATAFFGLLGTLTMAMEIGKPFGRFIAYGFFEHTTSDLSYETPEWWGPITYGFLRYGDRLVTINGLPFTPNARSELPATFRRGEHVELEIQRMGEEDPVTVLLPIIPFSFWDFLDVKLPDILLGVVFWLIAFLVLRARPDVLTNRVFATSAAIVAAHRLTAVTSILTDNTWLVNLPKICHMIAAGLIGPLIIHLALLFPTPIKRAHNKWLIVLYSVGSISGIVLAMSRLPVWRLLTEATAVFLGSLAYQTMLVLVLIGIITLAIRLLWSWVNRRSANQRERRIVKIVFLGLLISLPPILVILAPLVPGMGQERDSFLLGLDLRYFLLATPVAFALAIVRYQTFQSPSPLFIYVISFSISALLANIGVALWLNSLPADRTATLRPPFPEIFFFVLIASIFWSRQADWRGWFGRFLNRTDRNYESVRSFGIRVMGVNDMRVLPETIAQAIVDELELVRAAVWLWNAKTGTYELSASAGTITRPLASRLTPTQDRLPAARVHHISWPPMPAWLRDPAAASDIELLLSLTSEGRPIGILGLGPRWDEEIFDERDLAVVELVGQQASLFILAAAQVEELRRVPEQVAAAQEQERYRIAAELHDTTQQFLGRLPFYLAVSREKMVDDREEAAAILDRCMVDVEEASNVLREIRGNLAPNQLEISLIKPLVGLAAYVEKHGGLNVRLDVPDDLDESTITGTRHALYRVIQQATDNAIAHAGATELTISLRRMNGRILFSVIDDGRGSSEDSRSEAMSQGSVGLQSMRARVETVGGEFSFDSAVGEGTTVSGWVPAAEI